MANDNSKLVAILSYITIIGWVIAMLLHFKQKSDLGGFHLRQVLVIYLFGIIVNFIPVIGWIFSIVIFVFWVMGLVSAIQGTKNLTPIIGEWGQNWFKGI